MSQVSAGDTLRFKELSLTEAAALRIETDAQVEALTALAAGNMTSSEAESSLKVYCTQVPVKGYLCKCSAQGAGGL